MAGAGTSAEPEASLDHDTPKDPDSPSSFVADQEGDQIFHEFGITGHLF